ncbi:hypothetical protein [Actinoplanes sp. TFC3]|uniref:hypothetical protein n=1 Tax=Actinoplanes sp. TFC3 TaxID=1710355 RepID=UPI000832EC95|nr:hypothetical protein [Actinoplanes sp. TFC3]
MKQRASLALTAAILVLGVSGIITWRWWHNRPAYGPEALKAQATLRQVDQATADAALKPATAAVAEKGDQIFLGTVSWTQPPHPQKENTFRLVAVDKRSHFMPGFIAVTSAEPDAVSAGSDGALDEAEKRYSWLRGIGARKGDDGSYWTAGSAVFVTSVGASPVTFQTVLRPGEAGTPVQEAVASGPAAVDDLMVALISVGPDGQVYWANACCTDERATRHVTKEIDRRAELRTYGKT